MTDDAKHICRKLDGLDAKFSRRTQFLGWGLALAFALMTLHSCRQDLRWAGQQKFNQTVTESLTERK